jgi:hypothetical protein
MNLDLASENQSLKSTQDLIAEKIKVYSLESAENDSMKGNTVALGASFN